MSSNTHCIAIDIGASTIRVGVWRNGRATVLALDGANGLPAVVAFTDTTTLFGNQAKAIAQNDPTNVVFNVLHLLGRRMNDPTVQAMVTSAPFRIIASSDKTPLIHVQHRRSACTYYPQEIVGMLLEHAKKLAEDHLGACLDHAVVTVPATYTTSQRQAVLDAATMAGLTVDRLLSATTAVGIAHTQATGASKRKLLVVDAGASSVTASVVTAEHDTFTAHASASDTQLGGFAMDARLAAHCMSTWTPSTRGHDLILAKQRLLSACEAARCALSTSDETDVCIPHRSQDGMRLTLSREKLNALVHHLMDKVVAHVLKVLQQAQCCKEDVDDIVLVGGVALMPCLQTTLSNLFGGKQVAWFPTPSEAVVAGAALYIASTTASSDATVRPFAIHDALSTPIWAAAAGHHWTTVFRSPALSSMATHTFVSTGSSPFVLLVYEGDVGFPASSHLQGQWHIESLPHTRFIDVAFVVDECTGVLRVTASDKSSQKALPVTNTDCATSRRELQHLCAQATARYHTTRQTVLLARAKAAANDFTYSLRSTWHSDEASRRRVGDAARDELDDALAAAIKWLLLHPQATIDQYDDVRVQLEAVSRRVLARAAEPSWMLPE
ncbi:hypothetical protein SPRG_00183 [Saprolegnia parasitica CBS 223.65]|uniref:Uncharacterized protein n=1 Tax=Saprolegnia parasitica (strain CBS 223.65) TaxID=695850 RepID=A0A067CXA9_SAPPC|nr:hypothetical protein SPRG_00183 [Saprolegnia parasitica CBS 223.65]KDO35334.1 hypothetical protein SPRG_00183 [Saprolegnia parasitica CBS 223.65]|eukprot:XP_012193680.1 hypothetical protein SPRG_00183 [Saprolegnia parasitica CBS 223.65]